MSIPKVKIPSPALDKFKEDLAARQAKLSNEVKESINSSDVDYSKLINKIEKLELVSRMLSKITKFEDGLITSSDFQTLINQFSEDMKQVQPVGFLSRLGFATSETRKLFSEKTINEVLEAIKPLAPEVKGEVKIVPLKIDEKVKSLDFSKLDISQILKDIQTKLAGNIPIGWDTVAANRRIKDIKRICNTKYPNSRKYGNAALNRKLLLDTQISDLLDPDTLLTIFHHHIVYILRNSVGYTTLADAILFGFQDGVDTIKLMPNNDDEYGKDGYIKQKNDYRDNTTKIIANICKAAAMIGIDVSDARYLHKQSEEKEPSLSARFDNILEEIKQVKNKHGSKELVFVPGTGLDKMREECQDGFYWLLRLAKIPVEANKSHSGWSKFKISEPNTLEKLISQLLAKEDLLLDGIVSHLFYDRAHLEAFIDLNAPIEIGKKEFHFVDILREMIKQCDNLPESSIAREQFNLRLKLVESHLQTKFHHVVDDEKSAFPRPGTS